MMDNFSAEGAGMLETLVKISGTAFGASIDLPCAQDLRDLGKTEIRSLFNNFIRLSEQLSYLLAESATVKSTMSSMMPDIFDSPDCASHKNCVSHEFAGFIQLLQVNKRLSRDPQGTALQMKAKLLAEIKARGTKGQSIMLYKLGNFVQDIGMRMSSIIQKQPTQRENLEMEVNLVLCSTV